MKTISLYRPSLIDHALNDFDRYMESFFGESPMTQTKRIFNALPAVDIYESKTAFVVELELPSYEEKDIEVGVDGKTLTIKSKPEAEPQRNVSEKQEPEKEERLYLVQERRKVGFTRSFMLPENADPDSVAANFKNGILTLEIKKRTQTQKRVIPIENK
ncbi:MAG: Hsp20/alpha crystallin family protein [Spirochaetaceae bacterium]|jgi:HSP20 family protein|nr:Hsp20/alpha crystallin family protein [Spirochaetaceae bacterium]